MLGDVADAANFISSFFAKNTEISQGWAFVTTLANAFEPLHPSNANTC